MPGKGAAPVEDDNPFDIDVAALQKVPPVSPKPVKGRTVEVACPMCETKGFIASTQQGKDVRCANAECKFPIFKAPLPKKVDVDPDAGKSKGLSVGALVGISLVVAALVAGGAFFLLRKSPVEDVTTDVPVVKGPSKEEKDKLTPDWDKLQTPEKQTLTELPDIQNESLKDLAKAAQIRDNNPNRMLPRKWSAEGYAIMGQVDKAREELNVLSSQGAPKFYLIEPLVQISLAQRPTAAAEADKSLTEAIQAAADLPESSHRPLDAVSDLAAALVIAGRAAEAQTLLANPAFGSRAERSLLWSAASHGRVYDFSIVESIPAWTGSNHPQWAAATWIIAARGSSAEAVTWAKAAPSADVREGCLAAWAARVGLGPNAVTAEKIEAALGGESASARANAWANYAFARNLSGDAAAAKAALEKADAALAELTPPPPMKPPGIAEIHASEGLPRAGLPDPAPMTAAALAASSVARAHQAVGDDAVESNLQAALAFSAASAPSVSDTRGLLKECENNRTGVQEKLDKALNLRGNTDRRFKEFNVYRKQCSILDEQAQVRLNLERAILRGAASHGAAGAAWRIAKARQQAGDTALRQPFFEDKLPGFVAYYAYAAGDAETGKEVESSFPPQQVPYDPLDEAIFKARRELQSADPTTLLPLLKTIHNKPTFDHEYLDSRLLRLISNRTKSNKSLKSFNFVWRLSGDSVREDALWLLAAQSVAAKETPTLWGEISKAEVRRKLQPADQAALARGLIDGIANAPAAKK